MSLVEINWRPESSTLRQFGAIATVALPVVAWSVTTRTSIASYLFPGASLQWDAGNVAVIACAALVGGTCALLAWLRPQWLRVPFVALSVVTAPIGFVLGELLLAAMFFGVFLAVGLAFRLLGRNPLQWRFESEKATYWQTKTCGANAARYFRQY